MAKLGKSLRLSNRNGYRAAIRAVGTHERYHVQDTQRLPLSKSVPQGFATDIKRRSVMETLTHDLPRRGSEQSASRNSAADDRVWQDECRATDPTAC